LRQLIAFTIVSLKLYFRSREAIMWNIAFPIALMVFYITVFSGMYPEQISHPQVIADHLAKILAITIMSGGLFTLAISVSVMKEKGILRRYRITPMRPQTLVTGIVIRQYIFMMLIVVILFLIAILGYGGKNAGSYFDAFIAITLGIIVFGALGFAIAGMTKTNQSAIGVANLLFMPMLFISGTAIPRNLFPDWLVTISKFMPATHLYDLIFNILFSGKTLAQNTTPILILAGFGLGFLILASFASRWE